MCAFCLPEPSALCFPFELFLPVSQHIFKFGLHESNSVRLYGNGKTAYVVLNRAMSVANKVIHLLS